MPRISDSKVLIVATNGFEESELFGPREILIARGADVTLAAPSLKPIQATVHDDAGKVIRPDMAIAEVRAEDFDALILPGGVRNPDALRTNKAAIDLIRQFDSAGKPIAAICHGPWLLIEADVIRDRTVTGWDSIRTDLRNAGAKVVDQPVVVDGNVITSRKPDDIQAFTGAVVEAVESADAPAVA
jgi:protease I